MIVYHLKIQREPKDSVLDSKGYDSEYFEKYSLAVMRGEETKKKYEIDGPIQWGAE